MTEKLCFILFFVAVINLSAVSWPISNSNVQDEVLKPFGPTDQSQTTGLQYEFHTGIDIEAPANTPVHAVDSGTVSFINQEQGTAFYITISHANNKKSSYYHLNSIAEGLSLGSTVAEGQVIGTSGTTGGVSAHLHLEILSGNTPIHPLNYLPYDDNDEIEINMIGLDCTNPSFEIIVPRNELDVNKLIINTESVPYGYGYDWIFEGEYLINFDNPVHNVPVYDDINNIILNDLTVNDNYESDLWKLYIEPDYLAANDETQRVVYRLESCAAYDEGLEEEMLEWDILVYTTGNTNFETSMNFDDFEEPTACPQDNEIESSTSFLRNYPNPFNPVTKVFYSLHEKPVNPAIEIYNLRGQKIITFILEEKTGTNSVRWQGKDESGNAVASGIYLYRLINGGKTISANKMMLLK